MPRLSSPIENIKPHYEIVVIGSGYGGGIAASRLARAGRSVCLLERGKEFVPGEYPDTEPKALQEFQIHLPDGKHVGDRTALFDLHQNSDISVMVGCGLGGTSNLNANVSLQAEPRVYLDPRWPAEVLADMDTLVKDGHDRAWEMLKPTPYPQGQPKKSGKPGEVWPNLPKLDALKASAEVMNQKFYPVPINVTFEDGVNHVGVEQKACTLCGDCCSGCNFGAKNTLIMNYLPDAANHGAEIFVRTAVRHLEKKADGKWLVHYQMLDSGREKFDAPTMTVSADMVVVSAGTLGSTEILLRSRQNGLQTSDKLGQHMTGNGDVLAFGYNGDREINGIGWGHRYPNPMPPVGPCITGVIDIRELPTLTDGMVLEEGSIPGALGPALALGLSASAKIGGREENPSISERLKEMAREAESLVAGPYHGAVHNTQTYLIMTHDDGNGRMYLADDELRVDWPSVGKQEIFTKANDALYDAGKALGGRFTENPLWSKLGGRQLITVHPLGGCIMGADASKGVVNHKGQVFAGMDGTDVHEGLYVSDGAVIPLPLGVNPLLTISAVAERNMALAAKERGWVIDYTLPSAPKKVAAPEKVGMQFTETMSGYFALGETDFAQGASKGEANSSPLKFTVTVLSDDLNSMLTDQAHAGTIVGTLNAPALSADPLTVTGGEFHLFIDDPQHVGQRLMTYDMELTASDGRTFHFNGFKQTHSDTGLNVWPDTSTLYITVSEGAAKDGKVLGKGILHILPADFAKQMTTMKITNASLADQAEGMAKFGMFFGKTITDTYGGVFAHQSVFNPDAPPRKRRPLRAPVPQLYDLWSLDRIPLQLTRYQGGTKGPVILAHGLGVSSKIFTIDTIETNLTEYLTAHGYDVWLLDFRDSIDLPASHMESTADDVAQFDYPAAIDKVREITGAKDVQMVVHCYGSTTFFMAMLGGLQGVRSVVSSQIANDVFAVPGTQFKSGLHVPNLLEKLGFTSLTAYVDTHADWKDRLFDEALKLNPMQFKEHCNNPVCHRITFLYSLLYEHAQLNEATHDALHEMFGVANIKSLEHLSLLVRTKHLVNAKGEEVYMQHLDRLKLPICFIHGAENQCFLPISTETTFNALREANGKDLYSRHVIPGYGHIDCIYGKDAVRDVYPYMLDHLEATL